MTLVLDDDERARRLPTLEKFNIPSASFGGISADQPALNVVILNLMPKPESREADFLIPLGLSNLHIRAHVINAQIDNDKDAPTSRITLPKDEIAALRARKDITATIISGASLDDRPYDQVEGLDDLFSVMDWAAENTGGVFNICWAAMAGLHHQYGIPKYTSEEKIIGVFKLAADTDAGETAQDLSLIRAWDQSVGIPSARIGYLLDEDIKSRPALTPLARTPDMRPDSQIALISDNKGQVFMLNHPEYGPHAIRREYERDQITPQGGITTPTPTGDYVIPDGSAAPWQGSCVVLLETFLRQAAGRKLHQDLPRQDVATQDFAQSQEPVLCQL